MIIIDTDVLIEIFDKESEKGEEALKKLEKSGEDIAITSLNLHEVLYGHHKIGKKIKGILQMIPRIDTMIAAIALNRKAKIYTFNKKHFQTFKQIRLFD